jgi:O-succinylbenzoic acid--CoA ligase
LTETCGQVATQRGPDDPGVGPPLAGADVRVEGGAIEVCGKILMTGYLGEPPHHGWLRTGDLGRIDALGCLHVTGRASDLIITGGENVSPLEVEAALADLGLEACVVGLPDDEWGEVVAAAIVAPLGGRLTRLGERLAPFKRPRLVAEVADLPRGPTGKPDRRAARHLSYRRV